jgi:hypothetical protein
MLAGELRSQIDRIWNANWSGGIANPLEIIEQITYLVRHPRHSRPESQRTPGIAGSRFPAVALARDVAAVAALAGAS